MLLCTWFVYTSIAMNFGCSSWSSVSASDEDRSLLGGAVLPWHASSPPRPTSRTQRIRPRSSKKASTAFAIRRWSRLSRLSVGISEASRSFSSDSVVSWTCSDTGSGSGNPESTNARQSGNGCTTGYRLLIPFLRYTRPRENCASVLSEQHLRPPSPVGMTSTAAVPPRIICIRLMVFGVAVLLLQPFLPVHDGGGHRPAKFPVFISHFIGVRDLASTSPIHNCATIVTVTINALVGRSIAIITMIFLPVQLIVDPEIH